MPITRMDVMTMAPKSNEVTGYRVNQIQKPVHEQMIMSDTMKKTTEHNSKQTIRRSDVSNPEYRYDAKEKGNQSSGGRSKEQTKQPLQKKENDTKRIENGWKDPKEVHHIDIRI